MPSAKTPFSDARGKPGFWRVCRLAAAIMTEDEIEALVEARVLAVRAGWQRQAKEKIAEARAAGIAEGLQRGADDPRKVAEGWLVDVDGDNKLRAAAEAGDGGRALVKMLVEETNRLVKKEFGAEGERETVSRSGVATSRRSIHGGIARQYLLHVADSK